MVFNPEHKDRIDRLTDKLRFAPALTPDLISDVIVARLSAPSDSTGCADRSVDQGRRPKAPTRRKTGKQAHMRGLLVLAVMIAALAGVLVFAILGGMLAYLGATILAEVWQSPVQGSWVDWTFGIAITLVICNFGYLQGVALGVVVACLMFALNYSRIGVVRRHLTRQEFSSNVERSREQSLLLQKEGRRLHVLWLSGFIFFASSNVIFERVRQVIERQRDKPVEYVV